MAKVNVVDYDPSWPARFAEHRARLAAALGATAVRIEHVGSTAVPGLAAKPIIDIDVAVPAAADVPEAIERLRALGYVYQGDKGIRGREAFLWPPGAPVHHLYVVVAGDRPHRDHVRLREHLREHPEAVKAYAALKRDLAARYGMDRVAYTEAKTAFVVQTLRADPPEGV